MALQGGETAWVKRQWHYMLTKICPFVILSPAVYSYEIAHLGTLVLMPELRRMRPTDQSIACTTLPWRTCMMQVPRGILHLRLSTPWLAPRFSHMVKTQPIKACEWKAILQKTHAVTGANKLAG